MMGMKYSFEARFEFARRLSAIFQRLEPNFSMPVRWSAIITGFLACAAVARSRPVVIPCLRPLELLLVL
jgi:hypothetical protein